jgi:GntR family L-lactate dehydrogenase operon transcriptional regulator
VRWQHEAWSEHNIVQPLKTLLEDDPDYSFDILEARHAIEGSTAACGLTRTPIEKEKSVCALRPPWPRTGSCVTSDVRFHLAIAEASHNIVLLQTMRGFFDLLQSSVKQSRQRMYQVPPVFTQLTVQHREIMDAIFAGDGAPAKR